MYLMINTDVYLYFTGMFQKSMRKFESRLKYVEYLFTLSGGILIIPKKIDTPIIVTK